MAGLGAIQVERQVEHDGEEQLIEHHVLQAPDTRSTYAMLCNAMESCISRQNQVLLTDKMRKGSQRSRSVVQLDVAICSQEPQHHIMPCTMRGACHLWPIAPQQACSLNGAYGTVY